MGGVVSVEYNILEVQLRALLQSGLSGLGVVTGIHIDFACDMWDKKPIVGAERQASSVCCLCGMDKIDERKFCSVAEMLRTLA